MNQSVDVFRMQLAKQCLRILFGIYVPNLELKINPKRHIARNRGTAVSYTHLDVYKRQKVQLEIILLTSNNKKRM